MSTKPRMPFKKNSRPYDNPNSNGRTAGNNDKKCFKCSGPYPHDKNKTCPAIGKKCRKCGKLDHFESACRSNGRSDGKKDESKQKVEQIRVESEKEEDWESVFQICTSKSSKSPVCRIKIHGSSVKFRIDTCATVNVIDEVTYLSLANVPKLEEFSLKTFAYGDIKLKANVRRGEVKCTACFVVG